ncbi:MAG TPA: BRO family protein [Sedimentisphaerales bacterium]|nr:BRO family protein [Sedimentisphaerales bacterium]
MEATRIAIFRGKQIRRHWDDSQHSWFFSVVDVVAALTDSKNPAVYWRVLKKRLKDEGADQTVTKCNAFKMPAADGKLRLTDMADTETMFRLIQSIPSPKAEEEFERPGKYIVACRVQDNLGGEAIKTKEVHIE